MSRRLTAFFELLLLMVVLVSLGLGVNWTSNQAYATQPVAEVPQQSVAQNDVTQAVVPADTPTPATDVVAEFVLMVTRPPSELVLTATLTATVMAPAYPVMTGTVG